MAASRQRVLSGMRPTGKLHLGNYLGALENWVRLQAEYECFYFVANWHVLTTDAEHSAEAGASTLEMMADWLGAGLDPERSTLFIQSRVPEHAELHLLFSMVVPVGWLEAGQCATQQVQGNAYVTSEGAWYLGAIVDPYGMTPELIEDNNASAEVAHYSAALCHLANISYRLGEKIPYDKVSGSVGKKALVTVAVVSDPDDALPLHGTFIGSASDPLGMEVHVSVTSGCT